MAQHALLHTLVQDWGGSELQRRNWMPERSTVGLCCMYNLWQLMVIAHCPCTARKQPTLTYAVDQLNL